MTNKEEDVLVSQLAELAIENERIIATAESCTGGLIAAAFTGLSGSSDWFERGFVTYSNDAKQQMLGVSEETLRKHGAVSKATVVEMAQGAAGPTGGSPEKPVGTVWIACASAAAANCVAEHHLLSGDRQQVRALAVVKAIDLLIRCIEFDSSN